MKVLTPAGETIDLGTTETGATIGIIDYSGRVTDDFGVTTVVERGFARRMSVRLALPEGAVDAVQRRLADLRATSALWVADDRFASLSVEGFYKTFDIDVAIPPRSFCTLSVEGLAMSAGVADPGGDPAVDGSVSTFRLLQPVQVTDAVLAGWSVAENDAPAWSGSAAYAVGARVVAAHRVFESLVASNVGHDPTASVGKWLDTGPTNLWAMFDQALGTATRDANVVAVILDAPGANAVALLDVQGAAVRVRATGYDRTVAVDGGMAMLLDLPAGAGPVSVHVTGSGQVAVGTLLIGRVVSLGVTEASPTAGITDFSRKTVDDFGEVTIVQRAWAKRMTAKALIRTDALDAVAGRIAAVRARPSLWIGQDGLDVLTIYGFFKDFSIEVGETTSKLSLSIEGLSRAAPVQPLTVAWPNVSDPDGTKPDPNATNGADPASPFGPGETVGGVRDKLTGLRTDLDEIEQVYGDTATAAASAEAAAAARDVAQLAASNAGLARDETVEVRQDVRDVRQLALGDAEAAQFARGEAEGYAGAAAGHASTAAAYSDEAGDHAEAASGDAFRAETAGGRAEGFAGSAALSESNAAGSKSSAASSAEISATARSDAQLAVARAFPADVVRIPTAFTRGITAPLDGGPDVGGYVDPNLPQGPARVFTAEVDVVSRAALRIQPGRTYRAETQIEANALAEPRQFAVGFTVYDAAGIYVGVVGYNPGSVWNVGQPVRTAGYEASFAQIVGTHSRAAFIRPWVVGYVHAAELWSVRYLALTDVTIDRSAEGFAAASAGILSTVSTRRDEVETLATAAREAKLDAETARGDAGSFRDEAATSRDTAAGSASTASDQARLSAEARDGAGGYATASRLSSETASARADDAGGFASIAQQQVQLASAASDESQRFAGRAEGYAAVADENASAARSSAVLAAGIGGASLNRDPPFADYPDPYGYPAQWAPWGAVGLHSRQDGGRYSPYAYRSTNGDGIGGVAQDVGLYQNRDSAAGLRDQGTIWVVLEVTVTLRDGDMRGAGLHLSGYGGSDGSINFATTKTTQGQIVGAGEVGHTYSWAEIREIDTGGGLTFYAMTSFAGFDDTTRYKLIDWHRAAVRLASRAEVDAGVALGAADRAGAAISRLSEVVDSNDSSRALDISTIAARVDGVETGLVVTRSAAATALGRTQSFLQIKSLSPDGVPLLTVYSTNENGELVEGVEVENFRVRGRFIVDKTISWEQVDLSTFRRKGGRSWTGSIQPPSGQSAAVPIDFTLPNIRPGGDFLIQFYTDARPLYPVQTIGTHNGRTFYTNRIDDGGLRVFGDDGGGGVIQPQTGLTLVDNDAVVPFDQRWTATLSNGSFDSGITDQGDYYERNVSQVYAISTAFLAVKWSAL